MRYNKLQNYTISNLILGTVALGLEYGISNESGLPSAEQSFAVLDTARKAGINAFDTARIYGSAEKIVGDYIRQLNGDSPPVVISKFKLGKENFHSIEKAYADAVGSVERSLDQLGLSRLPVCLYHMTRDFEKDKSIRILPAVFNRLIQNGLVEIGGLSVDHPRELNWFAPEPVFQAYQIPINIFDHRLSSDLLQQLHERGTLLFARSVFLQGLFFKDPEKLTGNLTMARPYLHKLRRLSESYGISIADIAFSYVLHMPWISSIVFGAEKVSQVEENCNRLSITPLSEKLTWQIKAEFNNIPEDIITPGNWII
jgi:aryl-alcohol dehydrogenase-like predicted oxidoreductase